MNRGNPASGAVEGDAFLQRDPKGRRRAILRVTEEDKPQGTMGGIEAKPGGEFLGAGDGRGGPEGTEPALMGGKKEVLHRAGGTAEFVESGNLATRFAMSSNGDDGLGLQAVLVQLGALFGADFGHGGDLVIKGLERAG